jgi:hypothetical protein
MKIIIFSIEDCAQEAGGRFGAQRGFTIGGGAIHVGRGMGCCNGNV